MMLPVLMLIGVGERHRFWIPLPMILLWPFWLLGWVIWLPLWVLRTRSAEMLRIALQMGGQLSGLRIDVDTVDGEHVHIRLI